MNVSANLSDWRTFDVFLASGDKLGKLEDLYYDADTHEPAFLCVKSGMLSSKQVLVPATEVQVTPNRLMVPWSQQDIEGAPTTRPDEELSGEDEERAFRRYGITYTPPGDGGRRLVRR